MFKLFLHKKILASVTPAAALDSVAGEAPRRRNRRVYERYNVDHKHLTLMNDQDILQVREVSTQGFSAEVSRRCLERMDVGDVYDARIRYLGEIHALQAKVSWKQNAGFVGFTVANANAATLQFLHRLVRPVAIATSLKLVDRSFLAESGLNKSWFHGDDACDLFAWQDADTSRLVAWQLRNGQDYVEWSESRGLETGTLLTEATPREHYKISNYHDREECRVDPVLDAVKQQLAVDILMALPLDIGPDILATLKPGTA